MLAGVVHATNLRAFRDCDVSEPFFRLYTLLVAVELALKDHAAQHTPGHDLHALTQRALMQIPASVDAQLTALTQSLSKLACTSRQGARVTINSAKYPDLRYIRLDADFPGDCSCQDVQDTLNIAHQLVKELAAAGVKLS
jgi:hypothetical protein